MNFSSKFSNNKNNLYYSDLADSNILTAINDIEFLFDEVINSTEENISFIKNDESLTTMYQQVFRKIKLEINRNKELERFLIEIAAYDMELFIHSLNVAIYSLAIAHKSNFNKSTMYSIAISSLLHDIGKISIPTNILYKQGKLSDEEFEEIKKHSEYGFQYLSNAPLPSFVLLTTLQHHERNDGSGYPFGIKIDKIHPFAKIVAIADVFDALTSERVYKKAMSAETAFSILEKEIDKFDSVMLESFFNLINNYPIGCNVTLNNGLRGIVVEGTNNPFKPIVEIKQVTSSSKTNEFYIVNLYKVNTLSIHSSTEILGFYSKIKNRKSA